MNVQTYILVLRIRIGIQGLMTENWEKITTGKISLCFLIKNCDFLIPKWRPTYRRSHQHLKENIQHFKTRKFWTFLYFWGSFLLSWMRIRIRYTSWSSLMTSSTFPWYNKPISIPSSPPQYNSSRPTNWQHPELAMWSQGDLYSTWSFKARQTYCMLFERDLIPSEWTDIYVQV